MTPEGLGEAWAGEGAGAVGGGREDVAEAATDGADVPPVDASGVIEAAASRSGEAAADPPPPTPPRIPRPRAVRPIATIATIPIRRPAFGRGTAGRRRGVTEGAM